MQRFERGHGILAAHVSTLVKIQTTLEKAGIRFLFQDDEGGIGVRLRR